MLRVAIRLDAAVLGVAALLLLLLAFAVWPVGAEPGDGPWQGQVAGTAFLFASFAGMFLAAFAARRRVREVALLAPLAGACVVLSYYGFDPYFAPAKQRYSDNGGTGSWWIYVVLLASLAVGLVAQWRPRAGAAFTIVALPVSLFTFLIAGAGH